MNFSIILKVIIFSCDGYLLRSDCQLSIYLFYCISSAYILSSVLNRIGFNNIVAVLCISYIRCTSLDCYSKYITISKLISSIRLQSLSGLRTSNVQLIAVSGQCGSVIRLISTVSYDFQFNRCVIAHCQFASFILYCIVFLISTGKLMARYRVLHRALAWVGNTSRYGCSKLISSYQSVYIVIRITMNFSIILKVIIFSCDGYLLRSDCQLSIFCSYAICICNIIVTMLNHILMNSIVSIFRI